MGHHGLAHRLLRAHTRLVSRSLFPYAFFRLATASVSSEVGRAALRGFYLASSMRQDPTRLKMRMSVRFDDDAGVCEVTFLVNSRRPFTFVKFAELIDEVAIGADFEVERLSVDCHDDLIVAIAISEARDQFFDIHL